jgi:FKBP-type peptidyl-prolyl cis-trans isomerase
MQMARIGLTATCVATLGFFSWGCGPPEMVPVVLPGSKQIVQIPEHEQAEALGEQAARGTVQPPTQTVDISIPLAEPTQPGESRTTADNLKYETMREGSGDQAKAGQLVSVHYVATLENGAQIDTSRGTNKPYRFRIGVDENTIRGWHLGIAGMRVGEMRRLTVPAPLAYREEGRPGQIPPNATLVFEMELMSVEN